MCKWKTQVDRNQPTGFGVLLATLLVHSSRDVLILQLYFSDSLFTLEKCDFFHVKRPLTFTCTMTKLQLWRHKFFTPLDFASATLIEIQFACFMWMTHIR